MLGGEVSGDLTLISANLKTSDLDGDASNNLGNGNIELTAKENLIIDVAQNSNYEERAGSKKSRVSRRVFRY